MTKKTDNQAVLMNTTLRNLYKNRYKSTEDKLSFILDSLPDEEADKYILDFATLVAKRIWEDEKNRSVLVDLFTKRTDISKSIHDLAMRYCWEDVEDMFNKIVNSLSIEKVCQSLR